MDGAKHEPSVGAKSEQDSVSCSLPHTLDNDGYKVEICQACKGWGKISGVGWPKYELFLETCKSCGGSGRIVRQTRARQLSFNELADGIKDTNSNTTYEK